MQVYDWQSIVNEHGALVWQTAYRLVGNEADAADCFQEAFLAALEISRRQQLRNVCGLLIRLATTRAIDILRQRNRQERNANHFDPAPRGDRNVPDPGSAAQQRELVDLLREAIADLPSQESNAFCLRYISQMSYRQIARELDASTSAVGVLLHRAKARLRQALAVTQVTKDEVAK